MTKEHLETLYEMVRANGGCEDTLRFVIERVCRSEACYAFEIILGLKDLPPEERLIKALYFERMNDRIWAARKTERCKASMEAKRDE